MLESTDTSPRIKLGSFGGDMRLGNGALNRGISMRNRLGSSGVWHMCPRADPFEQVTARLYPEAAVLYFGCGNARCRS